MFPKNRALKITPPPKWFALRATYGREKSARDFLASKGVEVFCPMQKVAKMVRGKRRFVLRSRLPNILFAFGLEDEIKAFVFDNVNLPFLRFYYRHHHEGGRLTKEPLVVPNYQIDTFKIICEAEDEDIFVSTDKIRLFEKGEEVRITQGRFAGVTGRVANFKGQKRVGIYIEGVATVATAYVPRAYLEPTK